MVEAAVQSPRHRFAAWVTWIALAAIMCTIVVSDIVNDKPERSVTKSYRSAVENWFAGRPLYNMGGSDFIYMPQAALVFAPWGLLPKPVGEVLWRCTILAVMAAGVYRVTRQSSLDDRWFLINTVVTVATAAGCARNGQSTLIITGLMLLATADIAENKWWRATILLSLAFAFKPVAIVLILLAAAIYPQMRWRLAIGMAVVAVSPFLTQRPEYVISQFQAFSENSKVAFSKGETGDWAQVYGMLKVFGLDLPSPIQQVGRLGFAAATLVACWLAARKLHPIRATFYLYSLSACYLMLFNSRTEGSTYAMVGPVYGLLLAEQWLMKRKTMATVSLILAAVLTVFNYDIGRFLTTSFLGKPNEIWLCPFVCVLVSIYLVMQLIRELRTSNSVA